MSDSDDDIVGMLPGGRALPPPKRTSFKAMVSGSSSDDDKPAAPKRRPPPNKPAKHPPATAPKQKSGVPASRLAAAAGHPAPPGVPADDDTESIQFQEGEDRVSDVSLDFSSDEKKASPSRTLKAELAAAAPVQVEKPLVKAASASTMVIQVPAPAPQATTTAQMMTKKTSLPQLTGEVPTKKMPLPELTIGGAAEGLKQTSLPQLTTSEVVTKKMPLPELTMGSPAEVLAKKTLPQMTATPSVPPTVQVLEPHILPVSETKPTYESAPRSERPLSSPPPPLAQQPNQATLQQPARAAPEPPPKPPTVAVQPIAAEEAKPYEPAARRRAPPPTAIAAAPQARSQVPPPPPPEPTRAYVSVNDEDEAHDLMNEILPLHPQQAPRRSQAPSVASAPSTAAVNMSNRSPSAGQRPPIIPPRQPSSSLNAAAYDTSVPLQHDPLEDLLARAQQRLREKERLEAIAPEAAVTSQSFQTHAIRGSSPARASVEAARRSVGEVLATNSAPETSKEGRLQRENQRLCEELAFLTKENQKLRTNDSSLIAGEVTKLQLQVEMIRQQLRDRDIELHRTKTHLESQLEDSKEHVRELTEEIKSYSATAAQYESLCRDKDQQIATEQQTVSALRSELSERIQQMQRVKDDTVRQREDDAQRVERTSALLEDAKRHRLQLTELNEKFSRDKEQAVADRRKLQDELRQLQNEMARERERHADEQSSMRREVDRQRGLVSEKERLLLAQLRDETAAKEHYQLQAQELQDSVTTLQAQLNSSLRSVHEQHRKELDEALRTSALLTEKLRLSERHISELKAEHEQTVQRERAVTSRDLNEKMQVVKDERDLHAEKCKQAEAALAEVIAERDHYRAELERLADASAQAQRAKDRTDMQCTKLSMTLQLLMEQDENLVKDNERLKVDLEQALQDVQHLRSEMDTFYRLEQQLQDLSTENDRLSEECGRLAKERNELVAENGKLAEEMLKWRTEVRDIISAKRSYTNPAASQQQQGVKGGAIEFRDERSGSATNPNRHHHPNGHYLDPKAGNVSVRQPSTTIAGRHTSASEYSF